jgi:CRP-like cAMP-binding protein
MALVDESDRSATARSKGATRLIAFFRPELHDIMTRFPSLGNKLLMNLAGVIATRLRKTNENLIESQKEVRAVQARAGGE